MKNIFCIYVQLVFSVNIFSQSLLYRFSQEDSLLRAYRNIDEAINDTLGVEKLILSYKYSNKNDTQLSVVPEEILSFRNIEQLYLSGHQISTLPIGFENLNKLKVLHLDVNNFDYFPTQICSLLNLEELELSINSIKNVPDCICQMKKLKILQVGSSSLSHIPDCIDELESLLLLSIAGGKFDSLPNSILKIKSLINLGLTGSRITFLPKNIGSELPNLRTLYINKTSIKNIPESLLNLEKLVLWISLGEPYLPDEEYEMLLNHSKSNPNWKVNW